MAGFQTPGTHDPAAHALVIGGREIRGFGDDAGVEYEVKTRAQVTVGIDGFASVAVDNSGLHREATITVKNGTQGAKDLAAELQLQHTAMSSGSKVAANDFFHFDPFTGNQVTAAHCIFLEDPQGGLLKDAGDLAFKVMLLNTSEAQNLLAVP